MCCLLQDGLLLFSYIVGGVVGIVIIVVFYLNSNTMIAGLFINYHTDNKDLKDN